MLSRGKNKVEVIRWEDPPEIIRGWAAVNQKFKSRLWNDWTDVRMALAQAPNQWALIFITDEPRHAAQMAGRMRAGLYFAIPDGTLEVVSRRQGDKGHLYARFIPDGDTNAS